MSEKKPEGVDAVLAKIESYPEDFKSTALRLHETITRTGNLAFPRLWYGMPGYAKSQKGPVLVYFRKDKFITFGQTENSNVEFADGKPCAVAWYFNELNDHVIDHVRKIVENQ
jgi:hypothetical protein